MRWCCGGRNSKLLQLHPLSTFQSDIAAPIRNTRAGERRRSAFVQMALPGGPHTLPSTRPSLDQQFANRSGAESALHPVDDRPTPAPDDCDPTRGGSSAGGLFCACCCSATRTDLNRWTSRLNRSNTGATPSGPDQSALTALSLRSVHFSEAMNAMCASRQLVSQLSAL